MTNGQHGTLYIGVTAHPAERITRHKLGKGSEFCRKYGRTTLVYAEHHADIREAIAREKAMKKWNRQWKLKLICRANPDWRDLSGEIIAN